MIFSGVSGTGKTTLARIFANELNEHLGLPIEIDAASNNGVDNVKQIVASASERSIHSNYKVYIIEK
jgi:DNA polymerase-3 subunit gamma/tau